MCPAQLDLQGMLVKMVSLETRVSVGQLEIREKWAFQVDRDLLVYKEPLDFRDLKDWRVMLALLDNQALMVCKE